MTNVEFKEIEILTHCDISRFKRAMFLAYSIPKEIKVICTIICSTEELNIEMNRIQEQRPKNIEFVTVADTYILYPTNKMRNLAYLHSRAKYVMYIDIDFVFKRKFWEDFIKYFAQYLKKGFCFCPIPLMNNSQPNYLKSSNVNQLFKDETMILHNSYKWEDKIDELELFTYHKLWMNRNQKEDLVEITSKMRGLRLGSLTVEPWGILHRDDYYLADEDFVGTHLDKIQFVTTLLDKGIRFFSMKNQFVYHLWHEDGRAHPLRNLSKQNNSPLWENRYDKKFSKYLFLNHNGYICERILKYFIKSYKKRCSINYFQANNDNEVENLINKNIECISTKAGLDIKYLYRGYKIILFHDPLNLKNSINCLANGSQYFALALFNLSKISLVLNIHDFSSSICKLRNISGIDIKYSTNEVKRLTMDIDKLNDFIMKSVNNPSKIHLIK